MTDLSDLKLPGDWARGGDSYDCTCFIGSLDTRSTPPIWPMYSF